MISGPIDVQAGQIFLIPDYELLDEVLIDPQVGHLRVPSVLHGCLIIPTVAKAGRVTVSVNVVDGGVLASDDTALVVDASEGLLHFNTNFVEVDSSLRNLVVTPGRFQCVVSELTEETVVVQLSFAGPSEVD